MVTFGVLVFACGFARGFVGVFAGIAVSPGFGESVLTLGASGLGGSVCAVVFAFGLLTHVRRRYVSR